MEPTYAGKGAENNRPEMMVAAVLPGEALGATNAPVGRRRGSEPVERGLAPWSDPPGLTAAATCCRYWLDRKSTRLNSSHIQKSRMPSSA